MEIWRNVNGYEGLYEVSNLGRVRSLDRIVFRKDGRETTFYGKIMSSRSTTTSKYIYVDLCKDGIRKHYTVHSLVARAFIGDYKRPYEVNHIDGDITNNSVDNLEIVTHLENIQHSIRYGRKRDCGENHVNAKISNVQASEMRAMWNNGMRQVDIGKVFGVSNKLVNRIVNNKGYTK